MEDADEEKVKLLESIRLQDAALSVVVDDTIATLDSDSDGERDSEHEGLSTVTDDTVPSAAIEEENSIDNEDTCKNPSWAEALEANQEYDAVLAQLEAEIRQNIAKVVKQLNEVQDNIHSNSNLGNSINMKSQWMYVFGMPYFKTENFYPCPFNEDYHTKKQNREICWSELDSYHQWVTSHKKALSDAVTEVATQKCLKEAKLKLAVLRKELESERLSGNTERFVEIEQKIADFDVSSVAQSMLDEEIANGAHDWMKISASFLDGKQSPESCRSFWNLYLHPRINKTPYTEDEEGKLLELAKKYNHQDWDKIAEELGTNRSGYQCFIVYQNKLNVSLKRNTWDPAEDKKLLRAVEKYKIGNFIPWGKVAYDMENRTKTQVFNRWTYSLNPAIKKGRFTEEEDIMILAGVQMWGEDFQRIANFLKDRTTCQVRDRYKHYLNRPGNGVPWTVDDDKNLIELTEKHGRNWAKISKWFPTKDRTQVRHRFTTLSRWRAKNPDAPISEAPARVYNPNIYSQFQEQWDKARAILSCDNLEDMVKAKNNLITSLVKKKKKSILDVPKKKKQSPIEADLVNYFRCSYDLPGGPKKLNVRREEAQKYAKELVMLLKLLNSKLNLPCFEEIQTDTSLTPADRDILANLVLDTIDFKDFPETILESNVLGNTNPDLETSENTTAQLFSDDTVFYEDDSPLQGCPKNIDYIPSHNYASLYVDLPVMNFAQDEVVADRNQDPAFFEPPLKQPSICHKPIKSSSAKGKGMFIFPPNLTTLVGLRTFLLNRRNLINLSNKNLDKEDLSEVSFEKLEEAKKKFDERMFCLFLWPALMSRYRPNDSSNIFNDDKDDEVFVPNPVPIGRSRGKKGQKKNADCATEQDPGNPSGSTNQLIVVNVENSSQQWSFPLISEGVSNQACKRGFDPSIPSTSGLPAKRRKVMEMESDDDPDDPGVM